MTSCTTFRATLRPGTDDAELLAHLRTCDACLDFALGVDPDLFFRAAGGSDMIPPGGVDAFVGDVMAQIRSRETETAVDTRRTPWWQRAAIAAMLASGIAAASLFVAHERPRVSAPIASLSTQHPALSTPASAKAVIESYDSKNATIVEVPSDAKDVQVVMIFDDAVPADL
jgi:hypothetical protein